MAEEFQAGICGENWWNLSSRSVFGGGSPCSAAVFDMVGSYGWTNNDFKTVSCEESNSVFQDVHKPQEHGDLLDSTLQIMNFCPPSSSSSSDWNQSLLFDSRTMLQEDMTSKMSDMNSTQIQKDFSPGTEDSAINAFKTITTTTEDFSVNSTPTCQGLSTGFPIVSSSTSSPYYPTTLLNSLLNESQPQPQQQVYNNGSLSYQSNTQYGTSTNGFSPSWMKPSPFLKPSLPKLQPAGLISNNTPFSTDLRQNFLVSPQSKRNNEAQDVKKNGTEAVAPFKRPRLETPSPLPTFKVRKEKLGDRITALQQLVSPFGKTDTASVLQEAIEYIKFLHDQVNALSNPYMKNGSANIQHRQVPEQKKDAEELKQDLRSRGLCLVPISSTFPVASETSADFWTPTFGGPMR